MRKQADTELHRLERALRLAENRVEWINLSVRDPAALKVAEDLRDKAREDLATHKRKNSMRGN